MLTQHLSPAPARSCCRSWSRTCSRRWTRWTCCARRTGGARPALEDMIFGFRHAQHPDLVPRTTSTSRSRTCPLTITKGLELQKSYKSSEFLATAWLLSCSCEHTECRACPESADLNSGSPSCEPLPTICQAKDGNPICVFHGLTSVSREAKSVREARLADVAARGAAAPRPAGPLQMTGAPSATRPHPGLRFIAVLRAEGICYAFVAGELESPGQIIVAACCCRQQASQWTSTDREPDLQATWRRS